MKEHWNSGADCPGKDVLEEAIRGRVTANRKNSVKYIAATFIFAAVLCALSGESYALLAAAAFSIAIVLVMTSRDKRCLEVSSSIADGDFQWVVGKLENKYRRDLLDISSSTPAYQIRCRGQWIESDVTTYMDCKVGERIILVTTDEQTIGVPFPETLKLKCGELLPRQA
ncbi:MULTISPECIES: hypothetical protein [unclassified Adlercreutzia]|uniref:hypothetical protein n=1 Tax=unclassified Adlercreutzia TaxID=2636013 RepID=UPI0013EC6D0B|nr:MULTISPECIES: hypothetical protein [unclassified Adlercreutzia]